MSAASEELQKALHQYTADTLNNIHTVREFCQKISEWTDSRKSEVKDLEEIKVKLEKKAKALLAFMKSQSTAVKLEEKLASVLMRTLKGLDELDCFLEAVEKLAVTSIYVFMEENHQVLSLPKGIEPEQVQDIIVIARLICPLLLEFKRDAAVFFLPKLQNLEVLSYQLDKYIQTTELICEGFQEKSSIGDLGPQTTGETVVAHCVNLSEDDKQRMKHHINQLDEIRKNQNFRMVFLFQEKSCSTFTEKFSECKPRMQQFLNDLEEVAVQLDRMNKGAKISSVAGSSVGVIGGALSIAGLALIPFTAGLSLALTMTGVGLGVTSGVNSVVTTATEIGVNRTQQKKASDVFQSFMEDVQSLQDCLEEAKQQDPKNSHLAREIIKIVCKVGAVGKGVDSLAEAASAAKALNVSKAVAKESKALGNMSKLASDIQDVGQAAVKGPLALGKAARAGFIGLNAFFIGMDVFFICKDGVGLAKGSQTEASQFIRARAALWSSEMDSWQKIHDSLCEGQEKSEKNEAMLETPFYPEEEE